MLLPVTYFKYVLSLNSASGFGDYYYRYVELFSLSYTNKFDFSSTNNAKNSIDHTNYLESNDYVRFLKYQNPMINYSYKSGNYLGIWSELYPSLITSFIEVTKNVTKAH
jgi:sulfite reductase alpha subunit-like flavoprotein